MVKARGDDAAKQAWVCLISGLVFQKGVVAFKYDKNSQHQTSLTICQLPLWGLS